MSWVDRDETVSQQYDRWINDKAPREWFEGYVPEGGHDLLAKREEEWLRSPAVKVEIVKGAMGKLWIWALVLALAANVWTLRVEVDGLRKKLGLPPRFLRDVDEIPDYRW